MRCRSIFHLSAALLALSACGTQEVAPPGVIVGDTSDLKQGALSIFFAPTARTYEELQAATPNRTEYRVFVDEAMLVLEVDGAGQPYLTVAVLEGGYSGLLAGVPAGKHHFELAAEVGGPTIAAVDAEIQPGSFNRMYVYGDLDALQAQMISSPRVLEPGMLHVGLINLVRSGTKIEAVRCTDATHCERVSSPLSLGESFDRDFQAGGIEGQFDRRGQLPGGAWIGYRQLPTAALPAPPVQPITLSGDWVVPGPDPGSPPPPNFSASPVYFSAQGAPLLAF
jgi:hypothetical protein